MSISAHDSPSKYRLWLSQRMESLLVFRGLIHTFPPSTLNLIAMLMAGALVFAGILHGAYMATLRIDPNPLRNWIVLGLIVSLFFWVEWMRRSGKPIKAVIIVCYSVVGILSFSVLKSAGGLRASEVIYLPVALTTTGWLLGSRHAFYIYILQAVSLFMVWQINPSPASFGGADPSKFGMSPNWLVWMVQQVGVTIAFVFSIAMGRGYEGVLARVEKLATTDYLTGLPNRRSYELSLESMISQSNRTQVPFSILILDVDHFKQINDQNSHAAGDYVLSQLGALFAKRLRKSDLCARLGGDEFTFILPDTDLKGAMKFANELLVAARTLELVLPDTKKAWPLTLSIGVTQSMPMDRATSERFYGAADQALYESKKKGRNQVNGLMLAEFNPH